ncbi:MAG: NAD(P)H-quinone oxidoreductase [Acidobacterium ailaaui]|nr:NAD(P)H-quinone oxidoreductase [Pseudacidobacterium ailaaui]
MRVVAVQQSGGPEVLTVEEMPIPRPGPKEILIQTEAAGINRADILQRQGHYPPPPGASPILGLEVSGKVIETGKAVTRWKAGDLVCALLPGGGYAEYSIAHEDCCLPVPESVPLMEAAALPEAIFTVWANLFAQPHLKAGESFLVHGGSSGIGTMAIQMARAFGAQVLTTAGSQEKCRFCLSLGAEKAFHYREEDWEAAALQWSAGRGVDVILDMVGGDYFPRHLRLLAPGGRLIHIATQRGTTVSADLRLIMSKRLIITGSTLRSRSVEEKAALREQIEKQVWPLLQNGTIRPVIDRIFPLNEAAAAHKRMQEGQHLGKLLLRMKH